MFIIKNKVLLSMNLVNVHHAGITGLVCVFQTKKRERFK